jgi:hypothetical protein
MSLTPVLPGPTRPIKRDCHPRRVGREDVPLYYGEGISGLLTMRTAVLEALSGR